MFKTMVKGMMVMMMMVAIFCGMMYVCDGDGTNYHINGVVESVEDGVITIVTEDGNAWEWEEDKEVFTEGDNVECVFNSMATDKIKDDEMLRIKVVR